MLEMVVDVDVVDQVTGKSLWSRKNFVVQGTYPESQEASEGPRRSIYSSMP